MPVLLYTSVLACGWRMEEEGLSWWLGSSKQGSLWRGSLAGFVFPLEGQGLGDAAVGFLGPEQAVGQAWVREMCLGSPVW